MSEKSLSITFPNQQGEKLVGSLELPADVPVAFGMIAHCFSCSKDIHSVSRISRALRAHGFAILRFDFTGLGASKGDFANTNFSSNVEDLLQAANFLRKNYQAPRLLFGHSLGGAAVLYAAKQIPETAAVATLAAPSTPSHLIERLKALESFRDGNGDVCYFRLGGKEFTLKKQFFKDLAEQKMLEHIRSLKIPLLIFHSPKDEVVSIDHARAIFEAANHPKSFISLRNANHLLTAKEDAAFVADMLAAWVVHQFNSKN